MGTQDWDITLTGKYLVEYIIDYLYMGHSGPLVDLHVPLLWGQFLKKV